MTRKAVDKVQPTFYSFPESLEELLVSTNVFPTSFVSRKRYWEGPRIQLSDDNPHLVYLDYWTDEVLD